VSGVEDIIAILVRRDDISANEAWNCVEGCQAELQDIIACGGSYDEVCDCIADWLGLEPDYLDILI